MSFSGPGCYIIISCHVFLDPSLLLKFLRPSLFLMTLTVLRTAGQIHCRMTHYWNLNHDSFWIMVFSGYMVRGLLIAVAFCCGAQALGARASVVVALGLSSCGFVATDLVAPRHVGSSWTRAWTHVPRIGRRILNHCATREVPWKLLKSVENWKTNAINLCKSLQLQSPIINILLHCFTSLYFFWQTTWKQIADIVTLKYFSMYLPRIYSPTKP